MAVGKKESRVNLKLELNVNVHTYKKEFSFEFIGQKTKQQYDEHIGSLRINVTTTCNKTLPIVSSALLYNCIVFRRRKQSFLDNVENRGKEKRESKENK